MVTKKEEIVSLPGCSTWVLANANATGYYRSGYQPEMVKAMASDVEGKLTPAERISLDGDIWASVRVGREPVGDYLAFAQGLQADRDHAVLDGALGKIGFIGHYLVEDADRDSYQAWVRQLLTPALNDVGLEQKAGETDEQKTLRNRLFSSLGHDARDPQVLEEARKLADRFIDDPNSVDHDLARAAFPLAALDGDETFYDRVVAALQATKSPEEYYGYLSTLSQFSDPKLLQRTLDLAVSPGVRSQDALRVISNVLHNPAGEKLAWDFIQTHWDAVSKAGGPFASAEVVGATGSFCDAGMRDQVTDFFAAHKIAAAERTFRQSIERISVCVDLKARQQPQLASWLGQHGTAGGN